MLLYLSWLLSEITNKQIHEVWFLPESAYQKSFSKIWASLCSCTQNLKLHTLVFTLASLINYKQTNPWDMILIRICLPKLFFKIWAFCAAIYKIQRLHALVCILASLKNNKQTNPRDMILAKICLLKNIFLTSGPPT